jgi:dolichol kinase
MWRDGTMLRSLEELVGLLGPEGSRSSGMNDDGLSMKDKEELRSYLHSKRFRILSWGCTALLIASFVFPLYRLRWLYAAAALSFLAMVPLVRISKLRNRTLDLRTKRDKRYVLFVAIYVGGVILFAVLYTIYTVKH